MSEWEIYFLEDVGKIQPSNVDKKTKRTEKRVRLCNYMDVYSARYQYNNSAFMVASATPDEIRKFSLNKNDILITKDSETAGDIGQPSVVFENLENTLCGYHLAKIRPSEKFCGVFIMFALQTDVARRHLTNSANGITRYGLTINSLSKTPFMAPKDPIEQAKIAEVLSSIDTVIEKTKALIAKYKAVKEGLLQDLLTNGIDEKGRIRSPKTHQYKPSPLGMIPVEWDDPKALADARISLINSIKSKIPNVFIYIDLECVDSGKLISENIVEKKDAPSRARRLVFTDDILYQLVRPYQKNNLHVVTNSLIPYVASTGYAQIKAKGNSQYLFYVLHTELFTKKVIALCSGTGYPAITSNELGRILVNDIPIEEQKEIAKRLHAIDQVISCEQQHLMKLEMQKQGLMQDLLTNTVSVEPLLAKAR